MRKVAISEKFCLLIPLKFKIGKKVGKCIRAQKARLHALWCDGDLSFNEILPLLTRSCSTYLYYDNVLEKKLKNLTNQLIKQSNRCFESWTFLLMKETDLIVRVHPFLKKLSDQPAGLARLRHCPKGHLVKIWANLDQNWDRAKSRKFGTSNRVLRRHLPFGTPCDVRGAKKIER